MIVSGGDTCVLFFWFPSPHGTDRSRRAGRGSQKGIEKEKTPPLLLLTTITIVYCSSLHKTFSYAFPVCELTNLSQRGKYKVFWEDEDALRCLKLEKLVQLVKQSTNSTRQTFVVHIIVFFPTKLCLNISCYKCCPWFQTFLACFQASSLYVGC